jgi:murein DD-endopeptidase MepM/ murein hydrolase activator NlpD
MRGFPLLILVLLLVGCQGTMSTPQMPFATETIAAAETLIHSPTDTPTFTAIPEKITISATPTFEITAPASETCDPTASDFCVMDGHFIFNPPIAIQENDVIESTYRFGATQNGKREPHHGVEFPNASGTPVIAVADGNVVFAGSDKITLLSPWPNFYGNAVVIEHDYDDVSLFTLYGHLSHIDVSPGQKITVGEKIGEVGATGAAIGSHLHFEVRLGRNDYASTRNPELWLIPKDGEGALAIRVADKNGNPIRVQLNVQRVLQDSTFASVAQPEAYHTNEKYPVLPDDLYHENFGVNDLAAGNYRLTFVYSGKLVERLVEIKSGKLTLVTITVK